jgi:hypothetical protein
MASTWSTSVRRPSIAQNSKSSTPAAEEWAERRRAAPSRPEAQSVIRPATPRSSAMRPATRSSPRRRRPTSINSCSSRTGKTRRSWRRCRSTTRSRAASFGGSRGSMRRGAEPPMRGSQLQHAGPCRRRAPDRQDGAGRSSDWRTPRPPRTNLRRAGVDAVCAGHGPDLAAAKSVRCGRSVMRPSRLSEIAGAAQGPRKQFPPR